MRVDARIARRAAMAVSLRVFEVAIGDGVYEVLRYVMVWGEMRKVWRGVYIYRGEVGDGLIGVEGLPHDD